jgi:hypothetical protein
MEDLMSFLDTIGGLLNQYQAGSGAASREEAQQHYDQITQHVPPDVLASTIGPAISSLPTGEVEERVQRSAQQMTPQQRGSLLEQLLAGLGGGGSVGSILNQIGVSPSVAQNPQAASPQDVGKVAAYTKENRPDLFHQAMSFYAQHPTLVKVMGTMAIAAIAKNLAGGRRPGLV